jgi:hypothetical protein
VLILLLLVLLLVLLLIMMILVLILLYLVLLLLLLPAGPVRRFPGLACAFILVPIVEDTTHIESTTFHIAELTFDAAFAAASTTG